MGSDTFTGIVSITCIKGNTTLKHYTVINSQCPNDFNNSIDMFKKYYDLNNLYWTTKKSKAYEIAEYNEKKNPTKHGIINIDYTRYVETIEMRIMYSEEYKDLMRYKYVIESSFTIVLHTLYLLFIYKLYCNLYY